ncbi:MAG: FAD-binding protein [Oscillospiraceae bacterium]|jgi:succinate dehydrogenase/fumarate reductase flavoprotein subunit|nr:FAD-binding protein [Oscillospiraceae bacterium]
MEQTTIQIGGRALPCYALEALVIGTGCAGYNAADWLADLGVTDIAILTEGIHMGTSRNTGSDKQTYYKLSIASDGSDSVLEMAQTLFAGQCVNGDAALIEAACSVQSFMKLVNLGVAFPTNRYGEFVGYKTDHDPRQRATSAGPLTSKFMTEALENAVRKKGIRIFDGMQVIAVLTDQNRAQGVLCIDHAHLEDGLHGLRVFRCEKLIAATGGPAGVYQNSVYPASQTGALGLLLEAGAQAANLQEWQYGLASTRFRWNVSGTYQQVLPRYISMDPQGNQREFLPAYFAHATDALNMVFLKGYQWPFDFAKVGGSSIIDLIVHHEIFTKGNRVFMDFRTNPTGLERGFAALNDEAYHYLENSNALLATPFQRLEKMNADAIALYRAHGIDLAGEPLEVSVCAQHHNGGVAVDAHWQSSVAGLYVCGEAAGTFGVYRPGGSALNATQVGAMRCAQHIAWHTPRQAPGAFTAAAVAQLESAAERVFRLAARKTGQSNIVARRTAAQAAMSACASHLRHLGQMRPLLAALQDQLAHFTEETQIAGNQDIPQALKSRELLIAQIALLSAMLELLPVTGSRGGAVVVDDAGEQVSDALPDLRILPPKADCSGQVFRTNYTPAGITHQFAPVRPIPEDDNWFENVWNDYKTRVRANIS